MAREVKLPLLLRTARKSDHRSTNTARLFAARKNVPDNEARSPRLLGLMASTSTKYQKGSAMDRPSKSCIVAHNCNQYGGSTPGTANGR